MENKELQEEISREITYCLSNLYEEKEIKPTEFFNAVMIGISAFIGNMVCSVSNIKEIDTTKNELFFMMKDLCIESLNRATRIILTHDSFNVKTETKDEE